MLGQLQQNKASDFKTIENDSLVVLEARISKSRCVQGSAPSSDSEGEASLPLLSPSSAGSWCSWACGSIAPVSVFSSASHVPFPCVCVCSFPVSCETTHHWILIQGNHILRSLPYYTCKDPYSKKCYILRFQVDMYLGRPLFEPTADSMNIYNWIFVLSLVV